MKIIREEVISKVIEVGDIVESDNFVCIVAEVVDVWMNNGQYGILDYPYVLISLSGVKINSYRTLVDLNGDDEVKLLCKGNDATLVI